MNEVAVKTDKANFGLWIYLMTDMILFASLFATFFILKDATAGGVSGRDILDPSYALAETIILLASSVTCGVAAAAYRFKKTDLAKSLLFMTIILGAAFLALELYEFTKLAHEGNSWQASAFLSGFFTLVGTHGLHISIGLIWAVVLLLTIRKRDQEENLERKFGLFALFWHFLDIIWIFIFAVVYLIGGLL